MGRPRYPQTPASAGRLFALSHHLMGALDLEGRIVWANPAWEVVLGRDPAALAGTPYLELLHPDDRERALAVQAELGAGQTVRPELEVRLRDQLRRAPPHPLQRRLLARRAAALHLRQVFFFFFFFFFF